MEVNFNALRKSLIGNFNEIIEKATNVDYMPEAAYDHIREALQALRVDVATLACCYDDEAGIVSLADEKILIVP